MKKTIPAPVLELDTRRPHLTIDGTRYELRTPDEFLFVARGGKPQRFARLGGLLRKGHLSATEAKEQAALLRECCGLILLASADVHDRLRDDQRVLIIHAFMQTQGRVIATTPRARAARTDRITV